MESAITFFGANVKTLDELRSVSKEVPLSRTYTPSLVYSTGYSLLVNAEVGDNDWSKSWSLTVAVNIIGTGAEPMLEIKVSLGCPWK